MRLEELFPGRFLRAADLKGKAVTVTIAKVRIEELPDEKGSTKFKGIVSFSDAKKEWVINRTNALSVAACLGSKETDDWIGKRITLYPAQIQSFGDTDIAIRVKGSPELASDIKAEIRLPRKKPIAVTFYATGKRAAPAPAPSPTPNDIADPNAEPPR